MEIFTAVLLGLLVLGWLIAYFFNAPKAFLLFALFFGGAYFAVSFFRKEFSEAVGCAFVSVYAFMQLALSFCFALRRRKKLRQRKKEQVARSLVFTLPERENTYLRDRLHNGLNAETKADTPQKAEVKLDYMRKLTAKLKSAALSVTDRMQINELSRTMTVCVSKDGITAEETRTLNECFASLLKMAAKYGL